MLSQGSVGSMKRSRPLTLFLPMGPILFQVSRNVFAFIGLHPSFLPMIWLELFDLGRMDRGLLVPELDFESAGCLGAIGFKTKGLLDSWSSLAQSEFFEPHRVLDAVGSMSRFALTDGLLGVHWDHRLLEHSDILSPGSFGNFGALLNK